MDPVGEHGHRLFVAVPLPEETKAFAERAGECLPQNAGLRFAAAQQLHCTLAFIGSCDAGGKAAAEDVVSGLNDTTGGWAELGGFLFLPTPRRTRVVALQIHDTHALIEQLFERVMSALELAGIMKRERRLFRPHVTLARLRTPGLVQPTSDCGRTPFRVESLCLFESELRRDGAVHTVLVKKNLQKA